MKAVTEAEGSMPHIKHATIGALLASLLGAAIGFVLWAKQLDYRGPNRHIMRLVGFMGLGLVTVGVALACLSIAFLQYLHAKSREETTESAAEGTSGRLTRREA
jgi:hypothetical protein